MVKKIEINDQVLAILGEVITQTTSNWQGLSTGADISEDEFLELPIPDTEVYKKSAGQPSLLVHPLDFHRQMPKLHMAAELLKAREVKNHCVYLPKTAMPWHTNRDEPGTRTYYSLTTGRAVFRWMDQKGNLHSDIDLSPGWTARQFDVSQDYPMWHSIWTEKARFSFGFLT